MIMFGGNKSIQGIRLGNNKIKEAYLGEKLVWPPKTDDPIPPPPTDIEIKLHINSNNSGGVRYKGKTYEDGTHILEDYNANDYYIYFYASLKDSISNYNRYMFSVESYYCINGNTSNKIGRTVDRYREYYKEVSCVFRNQYENITSLDFYINITLHECYVIDEIEIHHGHTYISSGENLFRITNDQGSIVYSIDWPLCTIIQKPYILKNILIPKGCNLIVNLDGLNYQTYTLNGVISGLYNNNEIEINGDISNDTLYIGKDQYWDPGMGDGGDSDDEEYDSCYSQININIEIPWTTAYYYKPVCVIYQGGENYYISTDGNTSLSHTIYVNNTQPITIYAYSTEDPNVDIYVNGYYNLVVSNISDGKDISVTLSI